MRVRELHRRANIATQNAPQTADIEHAMMVRAKLAVLHGADWLTADQVASMSGLREANSSAQPYQWQRDGAIFSLRHDGVDYFPDYGLEPANEYRPHPSLKKVLEQFGVSKDGWGLAYWFQSVNSFLGGKRPIDMLATDFQKVVAAAADEAMGVVHA